ALACDAAEETSELVTIGIKPTWACPGFGYIEQGKPVHLRKRADNDAIHRVLRFREKPNLDLAESFLRKGNFRWNAGMFVWSVPTVLSEFNRHAPELADFISQVRSPKDLDKILHERFAKLPRISFDYAIMEKTEHVLVVEASFDWDDVGSWQAAAHYFKKDEHGNAANGALTALDSSDNIVFNDGETTITPSKEAEKLIAAIVHDRKMDKVVIGIPRQMSGEIGIAANDALEFADKLRTQLRCPVETWDERLTTVAANRALRDAGKKTRQTRKFVDQVAAQMILQSYLDRETAGTSPKGIPR